MIKVAVVEDNPEYTRQEVQFLERFSQEEDTPIQISCYQSGMEFLEQYRQGCDIILLDIEMPGMSGMETAKELRKVDTDVCIIFVTRMPQYAMMGYEVGAKYYILKPVQYQNFRDKLKESIAFLTAKSDQFLYLKGEDGIHRVNISDIRYVEGEGHFVHFHTSQGVLSKRSSMKEIMRSLQDRRFASCGSSYLINMEHITKIGRNSVTVDGRELPISRLKKKDFMNAVTLYLGGRFL